MNKTSGSSAGILALWMMMASLPLAAVAQTAPAAQPAPSADSTQKDQGVQTEQTVVLSPFVVNTDKDNGYVATNALSGSRVNTPIKDIPIPIQVITSEFMNDIGATDLRKSLSYSSGIMLTTQNDLENGGGTYGSPYGPGGVNNPQGLTSNINQVQLKIRGFVTNNVLRDGFLRASASDSVNIDRIEVVQGPNSLLYGTGNFGGVVDYLPKLPNSTQQGEATFSVGSYDFLRTAIDVTGPISLKNHINFRLGGAFETSHTEVDWQKNRHYFLSPVVEWQPTSTTSILLDTEFGKSWQNGYGFQALRAVQGGGSTPINNDQIEAVAFYYPPGANHRSWNLSGPDTFNNQDAKNIELKLTQRLLTESKFVPEVNLLVGYNHSDTTFDTRNINGEIFGPVGAGLPGYNLSDTIVTTQVANSLGGQGSNNLALAFGTLPHSVVEYQWYANNQNAVRDQERVEITGKKTLFEGKWYSMEEQFLTGVSVLKNDVKAANWETTPGLYSYHNPLNLSPIRYGASGDGSADPAMFNNDLNNINRGWDQGAYFNNYAKLFDGRIILMNGFRHDRMSNYSHDTQIGTPGATPTNTESWAATDRERSYQNGVIIEITKNLSIYGLKAQGIQPNFGGLHNAASGAPVTSDSAKSRELGIKFDFLDGKISGTISHYKITKTAWAQEPWYAPAPMGNPRFNPNKDIVYELSGGFSAIGAPGAVGIPGVPTGAASYSSTQVQPAVVSAWNAAVAAGAVYTIPGAAAGRVYLDASKAAGAAYLDAAFAANQASGGDWPGWLYQGDSNQDPNINNATMDAAGFYNTALQPAWQIIDQAKGWDGSIQLTLNEHVQVVMNGSVAASVTRLNLGEWPKYPYPQDRWAVWYFQNGGFGLTGEPLSVAYKDPTNTATRTNAGVYPGDDTPKYAFDMFGNYKFTDGTLKGLTVGLGGQWHSQEAYFSGVTHGGQQVEQNAAGQPIVVYSPSHLIVNAMAKYEWKRGKHSQYVQLNIDNLLNDNKEYGLIYATPITARLSYGMGF